jgi:hypothetical protein
VTLLLKAWPRRRYRLIDKGIGLLQESWQHHGCIVSSLAILRSHCIRVEASGQITACGASSGWPQQRGHMPLSPSPQS